MIEQRLVCAVAAAARARVYLHRPLDDRALEPPHPAFVGFRRMAYVWIDGPVLQPVADRVRLWIEYLRDQGTSEVALGFDQDDAAVITAGARSGRWLPRESDGSFTLRGGPGAPAAEDVEHAGAAAARLDTAVREVLAGSGGVRRDELERALAILGSAEDGSELSDVAWPYFVLPDATYGADERRLLAAAMTAWPESSGAGADDALRTAAMRAVAAAVNSAAAREPVE